MAGEILSTQPQKELLETLVKSGRYQNLNTQRVLRESSVPRSSLLSLSSSLPSSMDIPER